jgi:hypothetical protein
MKGPAMRRTAVIVISALFVLPSGRAARCEGVEVELRQHVVSFLQRGGDPSTLPQSHPLRPLAALPLTATTSYQLLGDDEATLSTYYPHIYRIVMARLNPENATENGLIPGAIGGEASAGAFLSPTLNALAALEIYSLHFIAFAAGEIEDSHDLLSWSRQLSDAATRSFYDPSRNYFFPLDDRGYMKIMYHAGQALPLVLDGTLGSGARLRIAEKFQGPELSMHLWREMGDDLIPVAYAFLSHNREMGRVLSRTNPLQLCHGSPGTWFRYWAAGPPVQRGIFPSWRHISSLMHLRLMLEREQLMEPEKQAIFAANVDSLAGILASDIETTRDYVRAINTVNRTLGSVSDLSNNLKTVENRWRSVREYNWSRLSPRLKRVIAEASKAALDELRCLKPILSDRYLERSDLVSRVIFPSQPIGQSRQYEFSASLMSTGDSLSISRLYIGAGEQRWRITADGAEVPLSPMLPPFTYTGNVALPPTMGTGIQRVPVYFDFLLSGRRVELHHVESITLTRGHDVSLGFPRGKRLLGESLPINIVLRYSSDQDLRGTVEGVFMKELQCAPALPARFAVKKGNDVTTLPLTVSFPQTLSPGRYPFSIRIKLDGRQIAFFEETLDRPIRWFHLGPLSGSDRLLQKGVSYQDDLFKKHAGPSGYAVGWQEVPAGALDIQGAVLPARLGSAKPHHCSLFYTVVDSPGRQNVVWRITTSNVSSLWFNGESAFTGGSSPYGELSGSVEFRKGINSIFVACCWNARPDKLLLTLSDESGLPVPGLSNEVERIVDGFEQLADQGDAERSEPEAEEQRVEVILKFESPQASEVCVVGSFNNWETGATNMQLDPTGTWTVRLLLAPGRYAYKFIVDGESRVPDPNAEMLEPDGFGGMNSILKVR